MGKVVVTEKKALAVFVPTFNRGAVIKELLTKRLSVYTEFGIDFYICDSSEANETEEVTKAFQERFNNLYYVRFSSDVHANKKVYTIYQKYGWVSEYDFVWVTGDALRYSNDIIKKVADTIKSADYDLLVTYFHCENNSEPEITDINYFFVNYAWKLNLFGACVLNTQTMLKNVDWEALEEKYCVPDKINFSHTCFYFEQVATLSSFKAKEIHTNVSRVQVSKLRKHAGWYDQTFVFYLDYCVSALNTLPDVYVDKLTAIRNFGTRSTEFSLYSIIELRKLGILTNDVYKKYKQKWALYSGKSKIEFYLYTKLPVSLLVIYFKYKGFRLGQFVSRTIERRASIKRLRMFCKKHDKVYIYGAGIVAERYMKLLRKMDTTLQGLVVTEIPQQDRKHVNGIPVIDLDMIKQKDNVGIILGLNPYNAKEVKQYLAGKKFSGGVFDEYMRG